MVYIGIDPGAKGCMCLIGNGKLVFKDFDINAYLDKLLASKTESEKFVL